MVSANNPKQDFSQKRKKQLPKSYFGALFIQKPEIKIFPKKIICVNLKLHTKNQKRSMY